MINEKGSIVNIVDVLNSTAGVSPVSEQVFNIEAFAPQTGRVLGEDGKTYNLVDIFLAIAAGGGGGTGGITMHNLLNNLSFEESGHTGFASAAEAVSGNDTLLIVNVDLQDTFSGVVKGRVIEFNINGRKTPNVIYTNVQPREDWQIQSANGTWGAVPNTAHPVQIHVAALPATRTNIVETMFFGANNMCFPVVRYAVDFGASGFEYMNYSNQNISGSGNSSVLATYWFQQSQRTGGGGGNDYVMGRLSEGSQAVNIGFRPSMVIITARNGCFYENTGGANNFLDNYAAASAVFLDVDPYSSNVITPNGFIFPGVNDFNGTLPNTVGYIAFR
jgi:hypothetical protein